MLGDGDDSCVRWDLFLKLACARDGEGNITYSNDLTMQVLDDKLGMGGIIVLRNECKGSNSTFRELLPGKERSALGAH